MPGPTDPTREKLYADFKEAAHKRRLAYQEYDRLNKSWYSFLNPKAHRAFNGFMDAMDEQNAAHERLNDYVESRLR